jgi:diguanylate cyclase (GGDEF)-like protein
MSNPKRKRHDTSPQFRLDGPDSEAPASTGVVQTLQSEIRELRRENALLRAERHGTYVDHATGAHDARYFYRRLRQELARSDRFGQPVSVVVAEVLPLAQLSYVAGRSASDRVLRWVTSALERHTREFDVVARLGSAELGMVLPCTGHDGVVALTERLVEALRAERGRPELPTGVTLEVVFGGATAPEDGETPLELVMAAEEKKIVERAIDSVRFGQRTVAA